MPPLGKLAMPYILQGVNTGEICDPLYGICIAIL